MSGTEYLQIAMTESPSQQGRRSGINFSYWTLKSMGNVGSLNSLISQSGMFYCSAFHPLQQVAEFRPLFCHQSSICFLGFRLHTHPKGTCVMAQCKKFLMPSTPGELSYPTLWCPYGRATEMELGHIYCAGNSTWLIYWSPTQNF